MNLEEKQKMVVLAQRMVDGSIEIVDGCRQMVSLKIESEIRDEDQDFLMLRGFESETDRFPIGEVRKHYNENFLEKLDKELNEYIRQDKTVILEACKNLINKYKD